jgi:hypothetical protein
MPTVPSNEAIRAGRLQATLQTFMAEFRPEAAYFFADAGKRCALFVIDLPDPSRIPVVAESFFMKLDAEVDFCPVMNAEDLQRGLAEVEKRLG